jgi:ubiquinol-cytochrome c reductase iron-sulfur subunit
MASSAPSSNASGHDHATRRDFLFLTAGSFGVVGTGAALWPFIHSMNPAADVLALASTEVDLQPIQAGQRITVTWRGKPVFVEHRTPDRIKDAQNVKLDVLPDKELDSKRVKKGKEQWLVLVGVCTHLGCVPLGQRSGDSRGDYNGWFCPCHGSHYDSSGRIRRGPAPKNLPVPEYEFLSDTKIRIG